MWRLSKLRLGLVTVCALTACALAIPAAAVFAAIPAEQQKQIDDVEQSLKKLKSLLSAKKVKEATELINQLEKQIGDLAAAEPKDELSPTVALLEKKLAAAQRLLARAEEAPAKPSRSKTSRAKGKASEKTAGGDVSFMKQIFPVLSAKCGKCHVEKSAGGFSVATFANLKKGSENGTVFNPGKGSGSRLAEVIETGEMPKGGGPPVTPDELALLIKWIDQGAKFDGPSETAPLGAPAQPNQPAPSVTRATGGESVQFVRDLVPVLIDKCVGCHGGMRPAARFDMATFTTFLKGGDSGSPVTPGKPQNSLLVEKLRGTAKNGARMPLQRPPLEEEVIKKFETWIADGAKFDWPDANQSLDLAMRTMIASKMSHQELTAMRADLAEKSWRLADPDHAPKRLETDEFLLVGDLTPGRMAELAELAKAQQAKVAKLLQVPAGEPFIKGKLTIFAFNRHFEYTEFGTMVEKRELPHDWRGHWRYNVIDCYSCVVAAGDDDQTIALWLAEGMAGAYLENQGRMPRWFSEGAARVVAARVEPKSAVAKKWDEAFRGALEAGRGPDDFLKAGDVVTGDAAALSYGYMKWLMTRMPKFNALLADLRAGTAFDAAFQKHCGADPATSAAAWARTAAYSRR